MASKPADPPCPGAHCYPDTHYSRALADGDAAIGGALPPEAETVVIGGGLAGVATALDLAERGRSVALLEARRVGWGASGRNGGFVSDGFQPGLDALERLVGGDQAREMHALSRQAVAALRERIGRHGIAAGPLTPGVMRVALRGRDAHLPAYAERMARDYDTTLEYWPAGRVRDALATDAYADALLARDAFSVQPLALTRGLARAAVAAGADLVEGARVRRLRRDGAGWRVVLADGRAVRGRHVVAAAGGHVGPWLPRVWLATVPVATFVAVTPPLGDRLARAIAVPYAIYDLQFATNYYRLLEDGRLLWGGRVLAWQKPAAAIAALLRGDIGRLYPGLRGVDIEVAWGGVMGFTRHQMPVLGQTAPGLWFATGFGGHGVALTTLAGRLIGGAIAAGDDRWRMFSGYGLPFAGGPAGKAPAQIVYWKAQVKQLLGRRVALA